MAIFINSGGSGVDLAAVNTAIDTKLTAEDADKQVGTINAASFGGPGAYPAAEKNEYLLVVAEGSITHNAVTYDLKAGDRLRCTTDGTAVDTPANWVVEIIDRTDAGASDIGGPATEPPADANTSPYRIFEVSGNPVPELDGYYQKVGPIGSRTWLRP